MHLCVLAMTKRISVLLLFSTLHLLTKGHEFSTAGPKTFERLSFRKTGSGVYRTLVFDARGTTLADVHRFCVNSCSRENCCDGFILNQNVLDGGQSRSHSLQADIAPFHCYKTKSIQYKPEVSCLFKLVCGLWRHVFNYTFTMPFTILYFVFILYIIIYIFLNI